MQQPQKNNLVLDSRDCPLLPTTEMQCPFAKKGEMCDVENNHDAFRGAFKVVFRGITGHQAAVQQVYDRVKEINPELKGLPFASQAINDQVVTMIWQNDSDRDVIGDNEVEIAMQISAVDTNGEIFPRYIHHCVINDSVSENVKQDYLRIHNALQDNVHLKPYLRYCEMIENRFINTKVGSPSTFHIMYQEFGGRSLHQEINDVLEITDFQSYSHACTAMIEGMHALCRNYADILGKNKIAHMDIHASNIVALVSRDDKGFMSSVDMRLIDFGFSKRDVFVFVKKLGDLIEAEEAECWKYWRTQDPIEYLLLHISLHAINLKRTKTKSLKVIMKLKETSKWGQRKLSEVKDEDIWIADEYFGMLREKYEYPFFKVGVTVLDLYEYVHSCLKETLRSLNYLSSRSKREIEINEHILKVFQSNLYGSNLTDSGFYGPIEAKNAQIMFDLYSIFNICILAALQLRKHGSTLVVQNKDKSQYNLLINNIEHTTLKLFSDKMIQRFRPFYKLLQEKRLMQVELQTKADILGDIKDSYTTFELTFMAASRDETVLLYTWFMNRELVGLSDSDAKPSGWDYHATILNFVNRKKEVLFTCLIWHVVTAARFEPGTYEIILWTEDSGMFLMHVGDKRYRKYTGPVITAPSGPALSLQKEKLDISPESILELLEDSPGAA